MLKNGSTREIGLIKSYNLSDRRINRKNKTGEICRDVISRHIKLETNKCQPTEISQDFEIKICFIC